MRQNTPTREDYLETMYMLIKEKGYATTIDMASHLHVRSPAVTMMMRRLHKNGYVDYEKYRGSVLTYEGERIAKSVVDRHVTIARFLRMLGVDEETAHKDTEGIEHNVDPKTMDCLTRFLKFAEGNPKWLKKYPPFEEYHEEIARHGKIELDLSTLKHAHELRKRSRE